MTTHIEQLRSAILNGDEAIDTAKRIINLAGINPMENESVMYTLTVSDLVLGQIARALNRPTREPSIYEPYFSIFITLGDRSTVCLRGSSKVATVKYEDE